MNADPNYGALWFHTRHQSNDLLVDVLKKAELSLQHELLHTQVFYARAMMRYIYTCLQQHQQQMKHYEAEEEAVRLQSLLDDFAWCYDETTQHPPVSSPSSPSQPVVQLSDGSLYCNGDFITASIEMNRLLFSSSSHDNNSNNSSNMSGGGGVSPSLSKYFHSIDQIVS